MCIRDRGYTLLGSAYLLFNVGNLQDIVNRALLNEESAIALVAVSYTHLDVYKRQLLYQNGSWSKALEAYEEVKEIIPENADIWTDMAACYNNTSQEKKEIECCLLYTSRCV